MQPPMREHLAYFEHKQRIRRAEWRAPLLSELEREARRPALRTERQRLPFRLLAALPFRT